MKKVLPTPEDRMLHLLDYALANKIAEKEGDYWAMISFPRNNITNLKAGKQKFTREQIKSACEVTGASADWVLGLDDVMFRDAKKTPLELLKQAVAAIEMAGVGVTKKATKSSSKQRL